MKIPEINLRFNILFNKVLIELAFELMTFQMHSWLTTVHKSL